MAASEQWVARISGTQQTEYSNKKKNRASEFEQTGEPLKLVLRFDVKGLGFEDLTTNPKP